MRSGSRRSGSTRAAAALAAGSLLLALPAAVASGAFNSPQAVVAATVGSDSPAGSGSSAVPPAGIAAPLGPAGLTGAHSGATSDGWQQPWRWPLQPEPLVVRRFDPPEQRWRAGHRGVDLVASSGADVLSPAAGTVHFAGWVVDRPVVTLRFEIDGEVLLSSFEPVETSLSKGTPIAAGEAIGVMASVAGRHCPAACLHWGVRRNGEYVDPLAFVSDRRPSILLPLRPP